MSARKNTPLRIGIGVGVLIVVVGCGWFAYSQQEQHRAKRAALATLTGLDQQIQATYKQVGTPPLSPAQLNTAIGDGTNSTNGIQYAIDTSDNYYDRLATRAQLVATQTSQPIGSSQALNAYGQSIHTTAADLLALIKIHKNLTDSQLQVAIDSGDAQFAAATTGNERTILSQYQSQLVAKDEQSFKGYQAQLPGAQQTVAADVSKLASAVAVAQ
jgi:hypothetical protein